MERSSAQASTSAAAAAAATAAAAAAAHQADVDRMWANRRARLAAADRASWPVKVARRIHTAWFQYLITLAPYCFEWWERLIVHALVAGGIAAAFYFAALVVRGAGLLWAARG